MTTPKPLKFGEVEWWSFNEFDDRWPEHRGLALKLWNAIQGPRWPLTDCKIAVAGSNARDTNPVMIRQPVGEPPGDPCDDCGGAGEVTCEECDGDGSLLCDRDVDHDCDECDASGTIDCPTCS